MGQLQVLEQSLRDAAKQEREHFVVGGFDIFVSPSEKTFLNLAVPQLENPVNYKKAIEAMRHAFSSHNRIPRLEFFHELHPELSKELQLAGFKQDMAAPVMALQKENLTKIATSKKGSYRPLTSEEELEVHLRNQSLAFGGTGDDGALAWLPSMLKRIEDKTVMVAALEVEDKLVSGASIQIGGQIGELAGVWTLPEKRMQGFAFELCSQFLEEYFLHFELCWLSAAEDAFRLYKKLGFDRVGTQLNFTCHS